MEQLDKVNNTKQGRLGLWLSRNIVLQQLYTHTIVVSPRILSIKYEEAEKTYNHQSSGKDPPAEKGIDIFQSSWP